MAMLKKSTIMHHILFSQKAHDFPICSDTVIRNLPASFCKIEVDAAASINKNSACVVHSYNASWLTTGTPIPAIIFM